MQCWLSQPPPDDLLGVLLKQPVVVMRDNFPRSVAVVGNRRLRNCHRVPTSGAYCLRFQLFTSLVKSVTPQMPCTAPPGLAAIRAAAPSHACLHTKALIRRATRLGGDSGAVSARFQGVNGQSASRGYVTPVSRGHVTLVSLCHVTPGQKRSRGTVSAEVT